LPMWAGVGHGTQKTVVECVLQAVQGKAAA
jgi:hypothetical protein